MHTIKEVIEEGVHIFDQSGVESSRSEVRLLLSHALDISIESVILRQDEVLDPDLVAKVMILVSRRAKKEPMAYILGKKEFYGIEFDVNKNVLIPRPDSEVLVDAVLEHFEPSESIKVLEFGVGSGCLLLSILKNMDNASGFAVDITEEAIEVAQKNYHKIGLKNNIEFLTQDWGEFVSDIQFDVIISNPPYIRSEDMLGLQEDVRNYEPHVALEGGEDGIVEYKRLAPVISKHLKEDGIVFLEFGEGQSDQVGSVMLENGFIVQNYIKDLSGRTRCIVLCKSKKA